MLRANLAGMRRWAGQAMKCAVALLNDLATARPHRATHRHTDTAAGGRGVSERGITRHTHELRT